MHPTPGGPLPKFNAVFEMEDGYRFEEFEAVDFARAIDRLLGMQMAPGERRLGLIHAHRLYLYVGGGAGAIGNGLVMADRAQERRVLGML